MHKKGISVGANMLATHALNDYAQSETSSLVDKLFIPLDCRFC